MKLVSNCLKYIVIVLFILLQSQSGYAQKPDWLKLEKRKAQFPSSEYVTGFVFNKYAEDNRINGVLKQLQSDAYNTLSQSVFVAVQSNSIQKVSEKANVVEEDFSQNVLTSSMVDLAGVQQEEYIDTKNGMIYVFCYIKKADLLNHYQNTFKQAFQNATLLYEEGEKLVDSGNVANGLVSYQKALTEIHKLGNIISIINTLSNNFESSNTVQLKQKILEALNNLEKIECLDIDAAAELLSHLLSIQTEKSSVVIFPFTYKNTQMTSSLSQLLKNALTRAFAKGNNFNAVEQNTDPIDALNLRGSIWEEGDKLRISATLLNQSLSSVIAAADVFIPKAWAINNNYEWKPANLDEAVKDMLSMQDLDGLLNGIKVEVFTDKGNCNILYTEDDEMKLYLKVNHECFIRMIYTLADGTKALLMDNHFIDAPKVNRIYQIAESFVCAPPFGVERLNVFASTVEFPPLAIEEIQGYQIITNNTKEIAKITRGFKIAEKEIHKGESSIVITTMSK